ncbi:kinase domain protein (macronuclear) [Tetrahymena thermophila SB210]|uniref:Kinase domain protein n=1 Tax=Tetrahymena thermophila (strain SB210) TaxID=312017 RepID=I7M6X1_TETTS|nr:kinase domain protein [Tetrahymena thermophila SB210]EAR87417.1 kinase domain protein [Tetrahymena thermophila SB210]|eukprot:XP_001007662.1 kinase domain protein [Tetrahymena thermophila SB210]
MSQQNNQDIEKSQNQQINLPQQTQAQVSYITVDEKLINQCRLHVRANRVALESKNPQYCACCQRSYKNSRISLFCSLKELAFLGSGVPLYFQFVKTARNMLIMSGLFSIYMIYYNYQGNYCQDNSNQAQTSSCYKDFYSNFSMVNIKNKEQQIDQYSIIQFSLAIVMFFVIKIFYRQMETLKSEVEYLNRSPEDYTAQLYNMPAGFKDKNKYPDIKRYETKSVVNFGTNKVNQFQVECTNTYNQDKNYDDVSRVGYTKNEVTLAIQKSLNEQKLQVIAVNIAYDLEDFQNGDQNIKNYILHGENRRQYCSKSCFVTFSSIRELNQFISDHQRNILQTLWANLRIYFERPSKKYLIFRNKLIRAKKAPAPDDVYWENISYGMRHPYKKRLMRCVTLLVNILLIGIALGCLFYVNDLKKQIKSSADFQEYKNNSYALMGLNFLSSVIIYIINLINKHVVTYLSKKEYHQTKTHLSISKGNNLFLIQLFNTAAIYVIIYLTKYRDQIWMSSGILADVMITHACIAVFTPLTDFILNFYKYLERYLCLPYGKKAQKNTVEEKLLINKIIDRLQGYQFDISYKYANTLYFLFSITFYGPLMPSLYVVGFFALYLQYWVDKYHIVKRYTISSTISADINGELYQFIKIIPLLQILSYWFWTQIVGFQSKQPFIFYGIAICLVTFILPNRIFLKIFCSDHNTSVNDKEDLTYNDALMKGFFKKFYEHSNPITCKESMREYKNILQKQQLSKKLTRDLNEVLTSTQEKQSLMQLSSIIKQYKNQSDSIINQQHLRIINNQNSTENQNNMESPQEICQSYTSEQICSSFQDQINYQEYANQSKQLQNINIELNKIQSCQTQPISSSREKQLNSQIINMQKFRNIQNINTNFL